MSDSESSGDKMVESTKNRQEASATCWVEPGPEDTFSLAFLPAVAGADDYHDPPENKREGERT